MVKLIFINVFRVYLISALGGESKDVCDMCSILLSRDCQEPVS